MALIKCPECGKEISDKSEICIGCGFPIKEHLREIEEAETEEKRKREQKEKEQRELEEKYRCRSCNEQNEIGEDYCVYCGCRLTPYTRGKISNKEDEKYNDLNDKRNISIRHKEKIIEIRDGKLTLRFPRNITITDDVQNFVLEYFSISMGMNVGLMINNVSKGYTSGVVDIVCKGAEKDSLLLFKEIMDNNGLYKGRNRFNVTYQKTDVEKEIENKRKEEFERLTGYASEKNIANDDFKGIYKYTLFNGKQEVYCPRCGSEKCSHYQEQRIIPGKTKTKYTANINPLKPLTLVNKKEKVIRKDQVVTESKFLCNSCGMIFK